MLAISFAGYNALRGQIEAMGLAGNPGLAGQYETMLILTTRGMGLAGLDAARPWGFVAISDGQRLCPTSSAGWAFSP